MKSEAFEKSKTLNIRYCTFMKKEKAFITVVSGGGRDIGYSKREMNALEHLIPDRQVYFGTFPYSII